MTRSRSGGGPRWPSSRNRSPDMRARASRSSASPHWSGGSRPTSRSGITATSSSELEALIAEHPLRERLRSQHMLALYRSGRHAEALASYQAFRRTLADELGIEPSASLRELERLMLQQDPAIELPTTCRLGEATQVQRRARCRHRVCPQRRRPDRLPGRWRRPSRPRSRPRLGLHLPARMGEPEAGRLLPAAGIDGAPHPLRQTRHRPLRQSLARAPARPGDAHGRRPCGHGCRRVRAGGTAGHLRRRTDVGAVRRDAPAADSGRSS